MESLAFDSGLLSTASIMKTAQSLFSTRKLRSCFVILAIIAVASLLPAQDAVYPPQKPMPAKIESHIFVLGESVVQEQWAHTLKLVNAPENVTLLNPGQCIRVGVFATGDNRDEFLEKTKLSFRVKFAGQTQEHALAPLAQFKQIKPEGGDFVTQALAAADIKNPFLTMASMGVSADHWCVRADAGDGTATVEAEIESPAGHQTLKRSTIQIESYETGSKKVFKDIKELSYFLMVYYRQPNPARLLPAMQSAIEYQTANPKSDLIENAAAFLSAALKAEPVAAQDFLTRIATQPPLTRGLGLDILRSSGYDISTVVKTLGPDEQKKIESMPALSDPYDLSPNSTLFHHLDLMWSTFGASGQIKPIRTIASTLAWRPDYDDFDKLRKSGTQISDITPSIARGLAYMAAGWSLSSFQRNDPLAADYIEYMLASPEISESIKTELKGLQTNPAFRENEKK
ncbi:MAG TPA: hypothetical protein VGE85_15715 [Terracidiphilus sp.]